MKKRIIKTRRGETVGEITIFWDSLGREIPGRQRLDMILKDIPQLKRIGYAGYLTKGALKKTLSFNMLGFDNDEYVSISSPLTEEEILHSVKEAVLLCHKKVKTSATHVFVFPTFSPFVRNKMNGVSGYTPYKNCMLLFVSPNKTQRVNKAISETICHEFMHTVMDNFHPRKNLLDDLVFEGVAESFVSSLFKIGRNSPSRALTQKESLAWYEKLKKNLRKTNLYYSVFLEGKKYPLWAGYAIGYHIVQQFRKQNPSLMWDEIVRVTPKEILKGSRGGFK